MRIHAVLLLIVLLLSTLVQVMHTPYSLLSPQTVWSQYTTYSIPSGLYVVPITINTSMPQPVYNYSLPIILTSQNFTGWDKINTTNIYFIDSNGHPLYYWVEELNTTTEYAKIWVNTTLTNTTIYMYYGGTNPYSNYDNPKRVFLWYDDFSTDTSSLYTGHAIYNGNGNQVFSVDTTSGEAIIGDPGDDGDELYAWTMPIGSLDNVIIMAKLDKVIPLFYNDLTSVPHWEHFQIGFISDPTTNDNFIIAGYEHPDSTGSPFFSIGDKVSGTESRLYSDTSYIYGYTVGITKYNDTYHVYLNGKIVYTVKIPSLSGAMYPIFLTGTCWNGAEAKSYWDWVLVTKYVDPSNYTVSITGVISLENIYGGYMSVEPTRVFGVLSVIDSYSYTANFTINVKNTGTVTENYTVTVTDTVSGATIYNTTVELQPGTLYTLWFTHTWTSPTNTTLYFILYGVNNTVYTNITVPVEVVEVNGAYVPITITYYGSQPVSNYTLMINLTRNNFNAWSYIGGNTTIAFLDSSGDPLYYWVDYLNKTEEQAIIYVNTMLTNTTIYMYIDLYPNPLISYDNPYRTFLLYDDFSTKTDNWEWNSDWTVSNGYAYAQYSSDWNTKLYSRYIGVDVTPSIGVEITTYAKNLGTASAYDMQIGWSYDGTTGAVDVAVGTYDKWMVSGTWGSTTDFGEPDERNWNTYTIILFDGTWKFYMDNKQYSTKNAQISNLQKIYITSKGQSYWDYVIVERYVDPSTYSVVIGGVRGISGAIFIGSISPTNVTVSIRSENSSAYVVFNMTVQNIGSDTGWIIVELIGDNDTTLYNNNITLTGGSSWTSIYNATFTYSDHGIHEWYYIVKNDTKTFVNTTVTITVVINITLTYNYTQTFNQTVKPSWINSSWYYYTISIPEPSSLEKWIPPILYNYTQSANIVLGSISWIQPNNIPRIIGSSACITLYTNTTGNWTQVYHVCNSYAYYLRIFIVLEPETGIPPDYPNTYIYILVWDNNLNNYTYMYSIYVPSGNQSVLLFADKYYKLEIPVSGTTIHGYSFQLDKYVLDSNVIDPPSIYLDGSHTVTIYYKIYSGVAPPPTTTTGIAPSPYPPPTYTFPYVTVPVVPPSVNVSIPSTPKIGYPGLDTPETVFSLLLYLALIILFVKLFNVYQAVAVASGIMMVLSIFLFGIVAMWLYFILFIIAVALYWKLGGT